jgi:ABC-type multidrug transport system fused ATPase/permease subunit
LSWVFRAPGRRRLRWSWRLFCEPLYVGISLVVMPIFRRRLQEKFDRGAENQAFLVETLSGIQTLKAIAAEPRMLRRWEEQLAGYVQSSFRVLSLGNGASQTIQLISKLVTAAILYRISQNLLSTWRRPKSRETRIERRFERLRRDASCARYALPSTARSSSSPFIRSAAW